MRSPHLHDTLRRFCLGAFAVFTGDLEDGGELPFAFEEHGSYGRPTLYEYRPLVRGFVEARAERLYARVDVQDAVADLLREPAARIFAHAHEGEVRDEKRAVYRSVLMPLLVRTAEGCGGFDWDDSAFARAYEELEGSLYGEGHSYGAVAPLRRRWPRARSSSSDSTGGRTGSGPCSRLPRPRRRASRRGSTRSAPRSRATCGSGSATRTTTRVSATRSTAGSSRSSSPSRSAASSFGTRSSLRSARKTEPGRPRCAARRCSGRRRRSALISPRSCASRAASCCGASSSPFSCTKTVAGSSASSTRRCSAVPRGQVSSNAPANRDRHVTACLVPSGHVGSTGRPAEAGADRSPRARGRGCPTAAAGAARARP